MYICIYVYIYIYIYIYVLYPKEQPMVYLYMCIRDWVICGGKCL